MRVDNFSGKTFGYFSFWGATNLYTHIFTNVTQNLAEICCFKYESSCKGRKTVVLVMKFVSFKPFLRWIKKLKSAQLGNSIWVKRKILFRGFLEPIMFYYGLQWTKLNLEQKIHCVFVDVSELVVLLSRHKIDIKEDITF